MANRHLSRSVVLQTLFESEQNELSREATHDVLRRNTTEFAPRNDDDSFMLHLLEGVQSKTPELDAIIAKAAPEWPIDRIAPLDKNILRIGLYELLFANRDEVPAKVALNESIELAKQFSGNTSGRFVNGVLGAVYRELGEPGKHDAPARSRKKEVPFDELPIERKGGAVVYAHNEMGAMYLALVHDIFGHWTLAKGGIDDAETLETGTIKKIKEEIGLTVTLEDQIGYNEYVANHPEKGKVRKQVTYFLAKANFDELTLATKAGLDDARWFKVSEILNLNFYEDILPIVTKAITILAGRKG